MGPCWLELAGVYDAAQKLSWCNVEMDIDNAKAIRKMAVQPPAPPLTVMCLRFQTIVNPSSRQNEVRLAAVSPQ